MCYSPRGYLNNRPEFRNRIFDLKNVWGGKDTTRLNRTILYHIIIRTIFHYHVDLRFDVEHYHGPHISDNADLNLVFFIGIIIRFFRKTKKSVANRIFIIFHRTSSFNNEKPR